MELGKKILREYILEERSDIDNIQVGMLFFNDIKDARKYISKDRPHKFFYHSLFD